jgi:hypothetical protein
MEIVNVNFNLKRSMPGAVGLEGEWHCEAGRLEETQRVVRQTILSYILLDYPEEGTRLGDLVRKGLHVDLFTEQGKPLEGHEYEGHGTWICSDYHVRQFENKTEEDS